MSTNGDVPTSNDSPFKFNIVEAKGDVSQYISHFFEFEAAVERFDDVERADQAQIRFMLGGQGSGRFVDGTEQPTTPTFVLGPTTGPFAITLYGPIHVFGVTLLTQGWIALVGIDASLLTNRVINAHDLYGDSVLELYDALLVAEDFDSKVALVTAFSDAIVQRQDGAASAFTRIVDQWLESSFSPEVDDLVAATPLSRRQVERNCKLYFGVTPKMLARKYRALRAALALSRGDATTNDCLGYGFYDQSHMIREIKYFTGATPGAMPESLSVLKHMTLTSTDHIDAMPVAKSVADKR